MKKTVPCFICKIPVKVKDERAIAKLCEEHDTKSNKTKMENTPVHQLLNIITIEVEKKSQSNYAELKANFNELFDKFKQLESQLKSTTQLSFEANKSVESIKEANPEKKSTLDTNEFGEVI